MHLPEVPGAFSWTLESWGPALRCGPLGAIAEHLFTTRHLELRPSTGSGRHELVGGRGPGAGGRDPQLRNESGGWSALARAIEVPADDLVRVRQVHGRGVVVVQRGQPRPSAVYPPEADVLISNDGQCAIAVLSADCVPLLIADPTTGVVAAAHAGWRGTAAGAARAAVEAMHREFGVTAADLVAAIGPSIGACCYEVGEELVDAFVAAGHQRAEIDRWFLRGR